MTSLAPGIVRLSDDELEALLGDLESDRVERKASLSDRPEIRKVICAFANDLPGHSSPGVVFIGVHDDGRCAALEINDQRLRQVADLRGEGLIQPLPSMMVEKRRLGECDVIVLTVEPSRSPPVRLRGRTWVRVGPTLRCATPEEEIRLAVLHRDYASTNAPVRIYWFSDRVEIHSPGGPFGQVTPENFGQPGITDYRNPDLAAAMKMLGYVERFGVGIQIARRELERNGNPPLEFDVQSTRVLATVRRRR